MLGPSALGELSWDEFRKNGFQICRIDEGLRSRVTELLGVADEFFRSAPEIKLRNRLSADAGYRPLGIEYSQSPDRPDQIESFSYLPGAAEEQGSLCSHAARQLFDVMKSVYPVFEAAAERLAGQFFERVTGTAFDRRFVGGFGSCSHLQINYRPSEPNVRDTDLDPHEDGSFLTIMSNTGPGLEIKSANGSFQPIDTAPDQMIVITGEILWLLSGGLVLPTHHRVRPQACGRMAILFFADLDPRHCAPWVHSPVNRFIDIAERSQHNSARFGLRTRG